MKKQASIVEVREGTDQEENDTVKENIRSFNDQTTNTIDMKIHRIQSELIERSSDELFEQSLVEAKLWFQPRHYQDVLDERSNEGMCGSPICSNSISKPKDLTLSLKISYKEKRLYEVGKSKLFCCNACFKNSALFEATLMDTQPGSRQVATDFLSNFNDMSLINGAADVRQDSAVALDGRNIDTDDDKNSIIDIPPPKFQNALLDAAGATKVPLMIDQLKEVLPPTVNPAKSISKKEIPCDITSPDNHKSSLLSSLSSLPILNYKKELPAVKQRNKEPDVIEIIEQPVIKSKQKKVNFSPSKSLESSVEEKWTEIIPPIKSSSSGKGSSRPLSENFDSNTIPNADSNLLQTQITEREVGNHIFLKLDEDGSIYEASSEGGTNIGDSIQDTYPSRMIDLKALSENNRDEDDDMESYAVEIDEISLFMLLWTALDDLFGHCEPILSSPMSNKNDTNELMFSPTIQQLYITVKEKINPTQSTEIESNIKQDDDVDTTIPRHSIDTTMLASHRSVAMFVERGFATAEKVSELSSYLNPTSMIEYELIKSMILATADLQHTICPSLKSSEFALLALLVVDAIVSTRLLISVSMENPSSPNNWELNIGTVAGNLLRVRKGRQSQQPNIRQLRDGDLNLLRSFFSRSL